jgi:hypothetical protein
MIDKLNDHFHVVDGSAPPFSLPVPHRTPVPAELRTVDIFVKGILHLLNKV